jgi:hypothetical protein
MVVGFEIPTAVVKKSSVFWDISQKIEFLRQMVALR